MIIPIEFGWNHSIGQQIICVKNFLEDFDYSAQDVALDFSRLTFCPPLLSVFFSSFLERNQHVTFRGLSNLSYHSLIEFPTGFKPDLILTWHERLSIYRSKTYLPLIHFNNSRLGERVTERNNIISNACRIVQSIVGMPTNIYSGISYLISELSDNIVDHSGNERGWISFQYYREHHYIDFCIADSGIGLLGSYRNYRGDKDFSHIITHADALECAVGGNSTKHLNERGFGIHTSRNMLINGLGGKFVVWSGTALLRNYEIVDVGADFRGSISLLRIPVNGWNPNFNVNSFVN